jgi:hypothetical protein
MLQLDTFPNDLLATIFMILYSSLVLRYESFLCMLLDLPVYKLLICLILKSSFSFHITKFLSSSWPEENFFFSSSSRACSVILSLEIINEFLWENYLFRNVWIFVWCLLTLNIFRWKLLKKDFSLSWILFNLTHIPVTIKIWSQGAILQYRNIAPLNCSTWPAGVFCIVYRLNYQ